MASILRNLVASPRTRHAESKLDLAYITPFIIATSGPSSTYPSLAYRNPLSELVAFLDANHKDNWCIWEFRAEGCGYPDSAVHGRVRHWPWPDHHPPPFETLIGALDEMKAWLDAGADADIKARDAGRGKWKWNGKVIVVHCKAGKGRSGTMACSYLMAVGGWKKEEALARFTERRMRPGFGAGVSIPSQLRYVDYVERWIAGGKTYVESAVEILEVRVWGLRDGVRVGVDGYVEAGRKIKTWWVFGKKDKTVVGSEEREKSEKMRMAVKKSWTEPVRSAQVHGSNGSKPKFDKPPTASVDPEVGGSLVLFKPHEQLIVPSSDINIDLERRNNAGYGMTMVTAVAHVWFNAYFECNGPEQGGNADEIGYFEIEWDKMDGIKGSTRKGTRSLDKLGVLFRRCGPATEDKVEDKSEAEWKMMDDEDPERQKGLGLRRETPQSADVSKANSVKSDDGKGDDEDDDSVKGVKTSGPDGNDFKLDGKDSS